jgi:hypothetical protein
MTDDREANLMSTLSLHLSDEELIALSEEADKATDRVAYLEQRYNAVCASGEAGTKEGDLLAKYQLGTHECRTTLTNKATRETREVSIGWLITQVRNGITWYGDRTHAFSPGEKTYNLFATADEARTSALNYASTINASAEQFQHAPKQILLKLPVCPSIPKPDKGVMVQVPLDTELTHALAMLREGCLAANQLIRGKKPVDSNADVIRKVLTEVIKAAAPTRNRIV